MIIHKGNSGRFGPEEARSQELRVNMKELEKKMKDERMRRSGQNFEGEKENKC